jgi:type VI secretion system secreted protein VgrG
MSMSWPDQSRVLALSGAALPVWRGENLFTVSRVCGTEKIGKLYRYTVEVATLDAPGLYVPEAQKLVDVDQLVGKKVTIGIAIEGNGTYVAGAAGVADTTNIGAGVREITGLIVSAQCVGADDRRAFYRLEVRPWLWLATLNRDSRVFLNRTVVEISEEILRKYPYPYELRLNGPGFGRQYPKRDYQRMFWESDFAYLNRLWQEWGISFYYRGSTLVLCDSPGGFRKHGPAYERIRYLAAGGQRIDEEHIDQFEVARTLTTGKVSVTDYDYTQSLLKMKRKGSDFSQRAFDNFEEYAWGDFSQPLAGPMGTAGHPNEWQFEAEYLAQVRLEAHRCKSLRAKGRGNLRGLMAGSTFFLDDYPLEPGDDRYLVVSTRLDIRNNDTATQSGDTEPYHCETRFTAQPLKWGFRSQQKAKKPRSHGEIAVVTGYDDSTVWTDLYGRVKVSFIWDRDRPADQNSSCWVRVSSPWQGMSYGAIYIPRVGHEVVIGYHDNDPDRPYIAGRHVNQFNEPPWALPANQALSGWLSQDLSGKSVAANSVVTDDTPGKLQVQVTSDQAQSRLVLGSNTRIDGHKGRAQARGEGFELATGGHGVLRANKGVLITTESRAGATAPMKDMGETVQRLTLARQQHEELGALAQQHKAQDAQASQRDATQTIKTQSDAIRGGAASPDNPSPEMTRPDLLMASAAGLAATAADSMHMASVNDHAITAGRDYSLSVGRSYHASVRGSISLFAYQDGMKFISAKGKVELQAQSDEMALAALKDLTITSTDGRVVITASKEVWIGAQGSYIKINGEGIANGTPGQILEKCASWNKSGPDSKRMPMPALFSSSGFFDEQIVLHDGNGDVLPNTRYTLKKASGEIFHGVTDAKGLTQRLYSESKEDFHIYLGHRADLS